MYRSLFSTFALGAVLVTAAFINSASANAIPSCPPGFVNQEDGAIHSHRNSKGDCVRRFYIGQYAYDQMIYTRRQNYDYSPGFGIYPTNGHGKGCGYNAGQGYGSRHRRHCYTPNIWRNHRPVWVTKCSRPR
jgi:hypothetical protein